MRAALEKANRPFISSFFQYMTVSFSKVGVNTGNVLEKSELSRLYEVHCVPTDAGASKRARVDTKESKPVNEGKPTELNILCTRSLSITGVLLVVLPSLLVSTILSRNRGFSDEVIVCVQV